MYKPQIRKYSFWLSLEEHESEAFTWQYTKQLFGLIFAGSLEAAYSLIWGAREIWGKSGGETLALL